MHASRAMTPDDHPHKSRKIQILWPCSDVLAGDRVLSGCARLPPVSTTTSKLPAAWGQQSDFQSCGQHRSTMSIIVADLAMIIYSAH